MTRTQNRHPTALIAALLISAALHLLPFLPLANFGQKSASTAAPPLQAELRPPPAPVPLPAPPPLQLPEPAPQAATAPVPRAKAVPPPKAAGPVAAKTWTQAVREHLRKLDAAGQFYPAEAIARGEQGEVLVLMLLDEQGKVSAARVEQGSGYPLLDAAALRAVRSLHTLPADAPREAVLQLRFRLR